MLENPAETPRPVEAQADAGADSEPVSSNASSVDVEKTEDGRRSEAAATSTQSGASKNSSPRTKSKGSPGKRTRTKRPGKPQIEQKLQELREALGPAPNEEQVAAALAKLEADPDGELLSFELLGRRAFLEDTRGPLDALTELVLHKWETELAAAASGKGHSSAGEAPELGFDDAEFGRVAERAMRSGAMTRGAVVRRLLAVALSARAERDLIDKARVILEAGNSNLWRTEPLPSTRQAWVRELGQLGSAGDLRPARFQHLLALIRRYHELNSEAISLRADLQRVEGRARDLGDQLQHSQAQRSELSDRIATLEPELADVQRRLDGAMRRTVEVDLDLRERHGMQMTSIRQEIKRSLSYEVGELQACLDRAEPNIPMALSRLRNIARIIERMTAGE